MELFITIIPSLVSGVIGIFLTHAFYKSRLIKEQKIRFQEDIGKRVAQSLLAVRDIVQQASFLEIYDLKELQDDSNIQNTTKYPSIMENKDTFIEYHTTIMTGREKNDKDLPIDVTAYL